MNRTRRAIVLTSVLAAALAAAAPAGAAEPRLQVPQAKLKEALHCYGDQKAPGKVPILLVTGTGASGQEAYTIGKGAFEAYGSPVCTVDFPHFTTGDIHVAVQYWSTGSASSTGWPATGRSASSASARAASCPGSR